jgi:hypothetical protein
MGRVRDVCYSVNVKGIRIEVVIYLSEKSFPGFSPYEIFISEEYDSMMQLHDILAKYTCRRLAVYYFRGKDGK